MAIQSTYTSTDHGFISTEVYTKINSFVVENFEPKHISVFTESFYDADARNSGKKPIGTNIFKMDFVENYTFADMYNFLKLQPEYTGVIDV